VSRRKATNSLHGFFTRANSQLNFSFSFINFLFSLDKLGQWVFGSTDPVEVEPMSSSPEFDAQLILLLLAFGSSGA
jgi:hypothetical protein